MKTRATVSLRKAQRLWSEFPYLWGAQHDWSGYELTSFTVQRLDSATLLQVMNPKEDKVFLHVTEDVISCSCPREHWTDRLYAELFEEPRALVDVLFHPGVGYSPQIKSITDALIVFQNIRRGNPKWNEREGDENRVTVYKPPRFYRSIIPFVRNEMASLREEKERLRRDQERLSVIPNA